MVTRVAAGLAERGREDLDDPEAERDRGDFGQRFARKLAIVHSKASDAIGDRAPMPGFWQL